MWTILGIVLVLHVAFIDSYYTTTTSWPITTDETPPTTDYWYRFRTTATRDYWDRFRITATQDATTDYWDRFRTTATREKRTSTRWPITTTASTSVSSSTPPTTTTTSATTTTTEQHTTTPYIGNQLASAVSIYCDENGWDVRLDMGTIQQLYPFAVASDIYMGDNRCTGILRNNLLRFQQGLRQCLTSEIVRAGALVYSNELIYAQHDPKHPFIISRYLWTIPLECDVMRNETSQGHVHHLGHSVVTAPTVVNQSHYHVNISFYRDPNFLTHIRGNPIQVEVGSKIYVKIFTQSLDWTVKMKVQSCYTKPSPTAPDSTKYYIIKNGCEVDSNTHFVSQSYHETRFVFQDFEYTTNHEGIYLYCETSYCKSSDGSGNCIQSCITVVKRSVKPRNIIL